MPAGIDAFLLRVSGHIRDASAFICGWLPQRVTAPRGCPLQTGAPCPTRSAWVWHLEPALQQTDRVVDCPV